MLTWQGGVGGGGVWLGVVFTYPNLSCLPSPLIWRILLCSPGTLPLPFLRIFPVTPPPPFHPLSHFTKILSYAPASRSFIWRFFVLYCDLFGFSSTIWTSAAIFCTFSNSIFLPSDLVSVFFPLMQATHVSFKEDFWQLSHVSPSFLPVLSFLNLLSVDSLILAYYNCESQYIFLVRM